MNEQRPLPPGVEEAIDLVVSGNAPVITCAEDCKTPEELLLWNLFGHDLDPGVDPQDRTEDIDPELACEQCEGSGYANRNADDAADSERRCPACRGRGIEP